MKWAAPYLLLTLVLAVGRLYSQPVPPARSLRLLGYAGDVYTSARLEGATLYASIGKQRKKLAESDKEGSFSMEYPPEATALIVEKTGYRTLVIATAMPWDSLSPPPFFIRLPMIPLDKQAPDKPYLQSQQEDFVLEVKQTNKNKLTRIFKVTNALTDQPVEVASICLDYTKVEKKECHTISPDTSAQPVTFLEADIVSVVVESNGYQTYRGNLILDKMDGSTSTYEIRLTPEITLLTMNVTNYPSEMQGRLVSPDGDTTYLSKGADRAYYAFGKVGEYSIRIGNGQGVLLHSEKVTLQKGLNLRTIKIADAFRTAAPPARAVSRTAPKSIPVVRATPLADTTRTITLYFAQSDYVLLPEACQLLDQLVMLLRNAPTRRIRIEGHSDNVGDPYRNETLSEYRARLTHKYLEDRGIGSGRMEWRGMGSRKPIASNDSEENKKKNRRVDITLLPQ